VKVAYEFRAHSKHSRVKCGEPGGSRPVYFSHLCRVSAFTIVRVFVMHKTSSDHDPPILRTQRVKANSPIYANCPDVKIKRYAKRFDRAPILMRGRSSIYQGLDVHMKLATHDSLALGDDL